LHSQPEKELLPQRTHQPDEVFLLEEASLDGGFCEVCSCEPLPLDASTLKTGFSEDKSPTSEFVTGREESISKAVLSDAALLVSAKEE
jgi:hypothetical protein